MAKAKELIYFDREKDEFVGITDKVKKQLKELHPSTDLERELLKMTMWLRSPKGKNRKGTIDFISKWLNNANKFSPPPQMPSFAVIIDPNSPLAIMYQDYLQELWKNREHILEANTIKA